MVDRLLKHTILNNSFKGKALIILGPRQTGKTTLAREIADSSSKSVLWLNGDESDVRSLLSEPNSTVLNKIFGRNQLIVIDEAQRIKNIGLTLKLCVDTMPERQFIVTGSSSFDIVNEINEPLTGRKFQYMLYPFSFREMADATSFLDEKRLLEHRLVYGYYPDVCNNPGNEKEILQLLCDSYLFKDIYSFDKIRKPVILEKLLQALALQIGSEVSYHEIGQLIGADNETVERYIDLLEKSFVIFKLSSLSRNSRNEIKKGRKIYFTDTGIRNAVIKNFNPLSLRNDTGALWENFIISERIKINSYSKRYTNYFFWRSLSQSEVDFVEERDGILHAYEIKWNIRKNRPIPAAFMKLYPDSETGCITQESFDEFIME